MKKLLVGAVCAAALGLGMGPAQAESDFMRAIGLNGPWVVTVKGNIGWTPKWDGANMNSLFGFPSASLRRPGEKPEWSSPDESVGYNIKVNDVFSLGPIVGYRAGRYVSGNRDLQGIHDTKWTLEPGVFFQVWAVPNVLRARIEIRRGFRAKDGFVADIGADWVNTFGDLTVAVGPRLSIADGSFMRYNYGVTLQDAFRNGQVYPYKATSGLKSAGVLASASYRFSEQWDGTLYGGYSRMVGDAGGSPIVKRFGDRNQWSVGATVGYSFNFPGF